MVYSSIPEEEEEELEANCHAVVEVSFGKCFLHSPPHTPTKDTLNILS